MSATTATNSSTTTQQRLQQREKERQQRGLQFQDSSVPFLQVANGSVHFSEPVKHEHEDAIAKRIKNCLGEFNNMKSFINNASGHKQLVGLSTSLNANRAKINNQNKAKIEAIFSEMKNTIEPLTGLDDTELPPANHITNSSADSKDDQPTEADRKELAKLKELHLNSSPAVPNKPVNNRKPDRSHSSSNHHAVTYPTNEHSDPELDEVSDDSQSPNHKNDLIQSGLSKLNNQINKYSAINRPPSEGSTSSSVHGKAKRVAEQDENYNESDDSSKRKRRKSDPPNNSLLKAVMNNHLDHGKLKAKEPREERKDESSDSDSDSDSASGSSSGSSGSSSSSEQEGGLSDGEAGKPKTANKTENSTDKNSSTGKEPVNAGLQSNPVNPAAQQPQRSWALSSFTTKLPSSNDKQVPSSHKSPPVLPNNHPPTKAQLKQQPPAVLVDKNASKNSIDPVKSSEKTAASKKSNYYSADSDSSYSSAASDYRKKESKHKRKSKSAAKPDKLDKRAKRSLSPQFPDLSEPDEPPAKSSKKSARPKERRPDKHESKHVKEELVKNANRCSPSSDRGKSPEARKKRPEPAKSVLPTSLCVSIDLSELDKKKFKKDLQDQKASNKENARDSRTDKESNYRDKYRSSCDRSDKKSSKEKPKNDKQDRHDDKHEKADKHEKSDKSEKSDKHADKHGVKHGKHEKKSKDSDEKSRDKESNKRKSTKEEENDVPDKSSKHKKSKKESSRKDERAEQSKSEKEDRLKESIKNELFDRSLKSNESNELGSSKNRESIAKSSPGLSAIRDKESRGRDSKENEGRDKHGRESKESHSSKEKESRDKHVRDKDGRDKESRDKEGRDKESRKEKPDSTSKEASASKTSLETDYIVEGKKWKHAADSEKDPIRRFCQYFEASLYFIQSARQFERNNDSLANIFRNYMNTLQFVRPSLLNKWAKIRTHSADEAKLTVLGLRCLSLIVFHLMKIMNREMRTNEKHIRSLLNQASADADSASPDQPVIVKNKMQLPIQLFSMIKKQMDYLGYYNETVENWQQADNILENDPGLRPFFKQLNTDCGRLSLDSSIDDMLLYARAGLKLLRSTTAANAPAAGSS